MEGKDCDAPCCGDSHHLLSEVEAAELEEGDMMHHYVAGEVGGTADCCFGCCS